MAEISVIIPARNELHLVRTIENVLQVADRSNEDIEVLALLDGWDKSVSEKCSQQAIDLHHEQIDRAYGLAESDPRLRILEKDTPVGQRLFINEAVRNCTGTYMAKIDAHCILSANYFTELKKVGCNPDVFVTTKMYNIDEATWQRGKRTFTFALLDYDLKSTWWKHYHHRVKREVVSETMSFMGTTWFCLVDTWWQLGGYDERLYVWGETGTEFSLKTWLTGKQLLLHKGVWCGHLFRKPFPYSTNGHERKEAARTIRHEFLTNQYPNQIHPIEWLVGRFTPVPTWERTLMTNRQRRRLKHCRNL